MQVVRGRLRPPRAAPATGEEVHRLVRLGPTVVEQILSGHLDGPVDYLQETDEWVVVLEGAATMEVAGTTVELGPGDWLLLPAGAPHRLLSTATGTSWLTVTAPPSTTGTP